MPVMPRESSDWTVDDLDQLPNDGLQYELLDGILIVTPAPIMRHQRAAARLFSLLGPRVPAGLELFFAPFDFRPDLRSSLQPDLLLFRQADVNEKNITEPLVLAVEILSPSTRRKDLVLKRSKYQDVGVEHYWIVDPAEPSILALSLVNGHYAEVGRAVGDEEFRAELPFPVVIVPSALVG